MRTDGGFREARYAAASGELAPEQGTRSTFKRAVQLWERGLSVLPVPRPDHKEHDGKVPEIAWRKYQRRRPSLAELRAWFIGPESNIAIITGRISGIVVIDVDSRRAMEWAVLRLPYTPWQTRTRRGYHIFYRHPGAPVRNRVKIETPEGRLAIDVRGDGGFVIAPGSLHSSGRLYEAVGDWSVAQEDLPIFSTSSLEKPRRSHGLRMRQDLTLRSRQKSTGDLLNRARRYLQTIQPPGIGNGSDQLTLYAACRLVRGFALSAADAELLLWEWAGNRPGWTHDWISLKVQCALRYGSEPIGALR